MGTKGRGKQPANLAGQTFGLLKAIRPVGSRQSPSGYRQGVYWKCRCKCGGTTVMRAASLRSRTKEGVVLGCPACRQKRRVKSRYASDGYAQKRSPKVCEQCRAKYAGTKIQHFCTRRCRAAARWLQIKAALAASKPSKGVTR